MSETESKSTLECVIDINDNLSKDDGLYLEYTRIGYAEAVVLHVAHTSRLEVTLWSSEDTEDFSAEVLVQKLNSAIDLLQTAITDIKDFHMTP